MSQASRIATADPEQLPSEMIELEQAIAALPEAYRTRLTLLYEKVAETSRRRRRILTLVQDALAQLRLDMKYLMFDLEATRRERDDLEAKLEGQA